MPSSMATQRSQMTLLTVQFPARRLIWRDIYRPKHLSLGYVCLQVLGSGSDLTKLRFCIWSGQDVFSTSHTDDQYGKCRRDDKSIKLMRQLGVKDLDSLSTILESY